MSVKTKQTQEKESFLDEIAKSNFAKSNSRIDKALALLQSHERGIKVLSYFRAMVDNGANGLDIANMRALQTLLQEDGAGRRDFLFEISVNFHEITPSELAKFEEWQRVTNLFA